jgi:hypothetical protein
MQAEIDELLSEEYVDRERKAHLDILERVLEGLEAIEVAATPAEREAAIALLPSDTGEDEQLDLLLSELKASTMWVSDFGMALRMTIARARFVKQLVEPTRMDRKLPVLYGHPPAAAGERPIDLHEAAEEADRASRDVDE